MIEKVEKKKERQHNLTKITGKTGEVFNFSPKKDMYIMQGEGKTRICKQYYTKKDRRLGELNEKIKRKSSRKAKLFS